MTQLALAPQSAQAQEALTYRDFIGAFYTTEHNHEAPLLKITQKGPRYIGHEWSEIQNKWLMNQPITLQKIDHNQYPNLNGAIGFQNLGMIVLVKISKDFDLKQCIGSTPKNQFIIITDTENGKYRCADVIKK